jgi:transcriptional regulator GlxA family with amidase domain
MQRIGLVLLPDFEVISFAALAVFEVANLSMGELRYDMAVLSEGACSITNSFGMSVATLPFGRDVFDTILVGAGTSIQPASPAVVSFLQESARTTRRVGSICVGAFALGEAGLLDGRRATTHWAYGPELQKRFPKAVVQIDRIFTDDGNIWTSAGMTAGIDLALGMVERDCGRDVARTVARRMVLERRRRGGQSQHSMLLEMEASSDPIHDALTYARNNLRSALSVEELARAARLSPRQFARLFRAETGQTPAKAVESLRLEAARLMTEQSALHIDAIAQETGFGDTERMRRAFVRAFGQSPQSLRTRVRQTAR